MFEGGIKDGVLVASVRVARSDVVVETNHRDGIRKSKKDFFDGHSLGIKRSFGDSLGDSCLILSKVRHGCDKRGLYRT